MKSGIILEIKKDKVVVVNKDGSFEAIKYKNGMQVGKEVRYNENSLHKITKIAAVFVVGIVSFVTITTYNIYNTPTTYIAFGSSSNVEFTANQFGKVISTNIKNEQGKPMLSSAKLLNQDITKASVTAMKMANEIGFIDDMNFDNKLNVIVIDENKQYIDNISKKIYDNLENYLKNEDTLAFVLDDSYNNSVKEEEIGKNLEIGKVYLVNIVKEISNDLEDSVIENMTVGQLTNKIKKFHIESLNNIQSENIKEFKTLKEDIIDKNRKMQLTLDIAN